MSILSKRKRLFPGHRPEGKLIQDNKLKGFHKPQREHIKQEMPKQKKD